MRSIQKGTYVALVVLYSVDGQMASLLELRKKYKASDTEIERSLQSIENMLRGAEHRTKELGLFKITVKHLKTKVDEGEK